MQTPMRSPGQVQRDRQQARGALGLLLGAVAVGIAIALSAYPGGRLTCGRYVLNAYLYVIVSLLLASLVATQLGVLDHDESDGREPPPSRDALRAAYRSTGGVLLLFVLTLLALGATLWVDPRQTLAKHAAWLLFVALFGAMLHPIYAYTRARRVFMRTALTTIGVVLGLTALAFWRPEWISLSWGSALLVMLIAGIVLRVVMLLLRPSTAAAKSTDNEHSRKGGALEGASPAREWWSSERSSEWSRWLAWDTLLSWGFVVLFGFLLLYDTKRLQVRAGQCGKPALPVPDYVNDSVGIFLDVANLFANLGRVQ
jgi:FtsH-binding integral membrane protein